MLKRSFLRQPISRRADSTPTFSPFESISRRADSTPTFSPFESISRRADSTPTFSPFESITFALPFTVLLLACSGSNEQPGADAGPSDAPIAADAPAPGPDANPPTTTTEDGGIAEDDASADAAVADGAPAEPLDAAPIQIDAGPPILPGATLVGWTTDERLVYRTTAGIYALDRDGGTDTVFTATDSGAPSGFIGTSGVFVTQGSSLGIWTKANGYHALSATAVNLSSSVQSNDGTKAFYLQPMPDGGAGSLLTVENVDGTGAEVAPCSNFNSNVYAPPAGALFTATDGLVVAASYPVPDSGTSQAGFDLFGPSLAPLAETPGTWSTDLSATTIFNVDSAGTATFVRASDGAVTPVDTGVTGAGLFDPAGANVYYLAGSALMRAPVASPGTKSAVVATGASQPIAISPDGTELELGEGASYFVVSTTGGSGATPTNVGPGGVGGAGFFTTDSTYVVSVTGLSGTSYSLLAAPVAGGTANATTTWSTIEYAVPMFDTRVLLYDASGTLFLADAADKTPTKIFATNVQGFAESWDNQQVAWQLKTGEIYLTPAK